MNFLRVAIVIAPQLFSGCLIYLMLLKRPHVALVELVSIGGVLGIISSTIFDQIFVNLGWWRIGWLIPVVIAMIVYSWLQQTKKLTFAKVEWRNQVGKSILPIIAIAAIALGTDWFWLFPSGVLLVLATFFLFVENPKFKKSFVTASLFSATVAAVFMISNRPKIWWMTEPNDYPFFQALSRSIADWGLNDYVLLSGTRTKYHWFTYAWIGLVERSSNTTTFFVLSRAAPVLFMLLIVGVIWSLIEYFSVSRMRTFVLTLIVMTSSSYPLWGGGMKLTFLISPSQFFTFAFLISAIFLLLQSAQQSIRFDFIVIALLSATTMMSKMMHGVILVSAILFTLCAQLFLKSKLPKSTILTCLTSTVGALATYFLFVSNPMGESLINIRFGDFLSQIQGDLRVLTGHTADLLGVLTVIGFSILPILLIILNLLQTKFVEIKLVHLLTIGSLIAGMTLTLLFVFIFGNSLFFLHSSIVLSGVLGFASLSEKKLPKISNLAIVASICVGIALCLVSYQIPNINSGAPYAIIIRSMRVYTTALILLFLIFCTLLINSFRHRSSFSQILKLTIIASAMTVSFTVVNWIDTMPQVHAEFTRDGETFVASPDMNSIATWINRNAGEDDIVASNFGWPIMAQGEIVYFRRQCHLNPNVETLGKCRLTTNNLLVAYLHRRIWLQATSYNYTGFTETMDSRQNVTLGFASEPNPTHIRQMQIDSVDWFIVDRSTVNRTSWEPLASIEYSNKSFFALKLNTTN